MKTICERFDEAEAALLGLECELDRTRQRYETIAELYEVRGLSDRQLVAAIQDVLQGLWHPKAIIALARAQASVGNTLTRHGDIVVAQAEAEIYGPTSVDPDEPYD